MVDNLNLEDLLARRAFGENPRLIWPPKVSISPPPRMIPGTIPPFIRDLPRTDWKLPPKIIFQPQQPTREIPPDPLLLLKAYADALRPFLTLEPDLTRAKKAIFVAGPMQYGIPTGYDPSEFINEALFKGADGIQSGDSPSFRIGGPSFFSTLNRYVENIANNSGQQAIEAAKKDYEEAKKSSEAALKALMVAFNIAHEDDITANLQDWLSGDQGLEYREALARLAKFSTALRQVEGASLTDIARARGMLNSANEIGVSKEGNNMPCALRDMETHEEERASSAGAIYRPLYFIAGYRSTSRRWLQEQQEISNNPLRIQIDPIMADNLKWESLGFPSNLFTNTTSSSPAPGSVGTVPVKADLRKYFGVGKMTLECTGIAAFDVSRGLWNIDSFRTVLPSLSATAEASLSKQIFKTTKLLLGYDVSIVLELDSTIIAALQQTNGTSFQMFPDVFGDIPFSIKEEVDGKTVLRAGLPKANAYPVLLAVLAEKV